MGVVQDIQEELELSKADRYELVDEQRAVQQRLLVVVVVAPRRRARLVAGDRRQVFLIATCELSEDP